VGANNLGGQIVYNFDTIAGAGEAIDTAVSTMRNLLSQLETDLRPLETDAWTSEAQTQYKIRKDKWTAASNHIAQVLTQVKNALESSSHRMKHTDNKAASYFQS
jgi:WXG100 family type VII secretion target